MATLGSVIGSNFRVAFGLGDAELADLWNLSEAQVASLLLGNRVGRGRDFTVEMVTGALGDRYTDQLFDGLFPEREDYPDLEGARPLKVAEAVDNPRDASMYPLGELDAESQKIIANIRVRYGEMHLSTATLGEALGRTQSYGSYLLQGKAVTMVMLFEASWALNQRPSWFLKDHQAEETAA